MLVLVCRGLSVEDACIWHKTSIETFTISSFKKLLNILAPRAAALTIDYASLQPRPLLSLIHI